MVDDQPYGKLIAPRDDTKYHLNLLPGTHECYLEVITKDESDEIFKSNVLVNILFNILIIFYLLLFFFLK